MQKLYKPSAVILIVSLFLLTAPPAWTGHGITLSLLAAPSTFHLMQIEQVIGGVNGDTSAQAIQLRMRAFNQNFVTGLRIVVYDQAGLNPVTLITFVTNVASGSTGDRILIASSSFAAYTMPQAAPDFIMLNTIPASYLNAGSMTIGDAFTVYWRLSWGGPAYTGPTTGSSINDADGNFGPAIGGPLQSADTRAVQFQGTATALSTNNFADYALTTGDAVFTNNAGSGFNVKGLATAVPDESLPDGWALHGNVPNPFNPKTEIRYSVPADGGKVSLRIYDARGRFVKSLVAGQVVPGQRSVIWDGHDERGQAVASGVYFYRLTTPAFTQTRKMVMLK